MTVPASTYLAIDVGGTKSAVSIGTDAGEIIERIEWPSNASRGADAMIADICRYARTLLGKHPGVAAAGVSIGGPLDAENGIIHSPPNLPGWEAVPLRAKLESALRIPVIVEHDAAACALAEYRWGAGANARRLAYLTCGTGLGAGLIFDGQIYYGAHGLNPEIGHARYRDDGPEAFGKQGSIEAFCSARSIARLATWRFPQRWPHPPEPQSIAKLAAAGDSDAAEVIAINARAVGDVCALLGDFLRPDLIVLGSLAVHLGGSWIELVKARFLAEVLPETAKACRIVPSALGARLQDCSALAVAILAKTRKQTTGWNGTRRNASA